MKFGVSLSPFLWWGKIEEFDEWIIEAESLGFDAIFIPDHYSLPVSRYSSNELMDAWTTLSYVAAKTKRIRIGTSVSPLPRYVPSQLAKIIATVDVLSEGRVIAGLGAGWYPDEFINYSPQGCFDEPRERVERFLEGLKIMIKLWTEEKVTFNGKYYKLVDAVLQPKPKQKPRPPLWSGGLSPRMLKITARYFDAWLPTRRWPEYRAPEKYGEVVATIKEHLKKYGRRPDDFTFALIGQIMGSPNDEIKIIEKYKDFGCQYYVVEIPKPLPFSGREYLEDLRRFAREVVQSF